MHLGTEVGQLRGESRAVAKSQPVVGRGRASVSWSLWLKKKKRSRSNSTGDEAVADIFTYLPTFLETPQSESPTMEFWGWPRGAASLRAHHSCRGLCPHAEPRGSGDTTTPFVPLGAQVSYSLCMFQKQAWLPWGHRDPPLGCA